MGVLEIVFPLFNSIAFMKKNKILGVKKNNETILDTSKDNIHLVERGVDDMPAFIEEAFSALMGVNGDEYVREIHSTNCLSQHSYYAICNNIQFNSKDSIINYFGLVHYYYLQGIK
jgi:hypothetical protein